MSYSRTERGCEVDPVQDPVGCYEPGPAVWDRISCYGGDDTCKGEERGSDHETFRRMSDGIGECAFEPSEAICHSHGDESEDCQIPDID